MLVHVKPVKQREEYAILSMIRYLHCVKVHVAEIACIKCLLVQHFVHDMRSIMKRHT